jgi:ribosome-associated protein
MLRITPAIAIDDDEISIAFVRASGPGGQNVNKVATAAHLRFEAAASPALTDAVRGRLARLAGRKMTREGVLIMPADSARRSRTARMPSTGSSISSAGPPCRRVRGVRQSRRGHRGRSASRTRSTTPRKRRLGARSRER